MSSFTSIWNKFLRDRKMPQYYTGIETIDYEELKNLKSNFEYKKAEDLIDKILNGKFS